MMLRSGKRKDPPSGGDGKKGGGKRVARAVAKAAKVPSLLEAAKAVRRWLCGCALVVVCVLCR